MGSRGRQEDPVDNEVSKHVLITVEVKIINYPHIVATKSGSMALLRAHLRRLVKVLASRSKRFPVNTNPTLPKSWDMVLWDFVLMGIRSLAVRGT